MEKLRKNYGILVLFFIMLALIIVPHCTPAVSVRTHLFFTGHPVAAVTSEIHAAELCDEQAGRQYSVSTDAYADRDVVGTEKDYSSLKVKKILFLYFASYGQA